MEADDKVPLPSPEASSFDRHAPLIGALYLEMSEVRSLPKQFALVSKLRDADYTRTAKIARHTSLTS